MDNPPEIREMILNFDKRKVNNLKIEIVITIDLTLMLGLH
jgi:hypothetical protein